MTPPDSTRRLADALKASLEVDEVKDLVSLLAPAAEDARTSVSARFLARGPESTNLFRAGKHHDIQPDILIHDPWLSTLGLVQFLPDTVEEAATRVDQFVDEAAYLRQLCLFDAESHGTQAYTIELTLAFRRTHANVDTASAQAMTRLRTLARETGYLRALGVSLLCEGSSGFSTAGLRRAFPWILASTRKWFQTDLVKGSAADGSLLPWTLQLTNYRNAPSRTYVFAGGCAHEPTPSAHLLHGYNGSGKTTFTEAFELLLTGRVDRIGDPSTHDYYAIVRHRPRTLAGRPMAASADAATVTLTVGDKAPHATTAIVSITPKPPGDNLPASPPQIDRNWSGAGDKRGLPDPASFRLDQVFMDSMIRSKPALRAERFLRAFFPEDQPRFVALAEAAAATTKALDKLPASIRTTLSAPTTENPAALLQWSVSDVGSWIAQGLLKTLAPCLPLSEAQIDLFPTVEPSLAAIVDRWRRDPASFTNPVEELTKFDEAIHNIRIRIPALRTHLETSRRFFEEFADWKTTQSVDRGASFEEALNAWLELQAAADLAARIHDVAATVADARAGHWDPAAYGDLFRDVPTDPARVAWLKEKRDELAHARDRARSVVNAWGVDPASGKQSDASPSAPRRHLSSTERESLNTVCQWLPSLDAEPSVPRLGDMVVTALETGKSLNRGKCSIGSPGGLKVAADEAHAMLAALEAIEPAHVSAAASLAACREAHVALKALSDRQADVSGSFFSQLAKPAAGQSTLGDALHELLALFKPAPWAYQEIELRARLRGTDGDAQTETLGFVTDNLPAELRLNTAEMNTFTLALFLLCAPTLPNPLRLLILDDPLQNMDEMTVSSLARGLGKLLRIFPPGWRLVALFHAEEDLHRIRAELPAAVYRIPWLNPTGTGEDQPPVAENAEESTFGRGAQQISDLLELVG